MSHTYISLQVHYKAICSVNKSAIIFAHYAWQKMHYAEDLDVIFPYNLCINNMLYRLSSSSSSSDSSDTDSESDSESSTSSTTTTSNSSSLDSDDASEPE